MSRVLRYMRGNRGRRYIFTMESLILAQDER